MGYRRQTPTSPIISIVPAGETETDPPIGSFADGGIDANGNYTNYEGSWFEMTYRCLALSTNADECTYLAAMMKQTLLRYRGVLTAGGLYEQRLSLTDLMPAENFGDPNIEVFQRGVQISGTSFAEYPVAVAPVANSMSVGVALSSPAQPAENITINFAVPILDTFKRADDTTTIGRTATQQQWTALSGNWGIVGNTGYLVRPGTPGNLNVATVVAGSADGVLQAAMNSPVGGRLCFRYTDKSNGLYLEATANSYTLNKLTGGVVTVIGTYPVVPQSADALRVDLYKAAIVVFINGALAINVTQAFNQQATQLGIGGVDTTLARWTRFAFE